MTLVGNPIPPLDHTPNPMGAPPGVLVDFEALRRNDGVDGPYWQQRPLISARVGIVHTNAASVEASLESSIGYGNRAKNNTKPNYHVARQGARKVIPTNRRAIANSSTSEIEDQYGEVDCSFWTYSIETADMGTIAAAAAGYPSGDLGPFLEPNHAEIVARIFAYESMVPGGPPLVVPPAWNDTGVCTHVWPFPFPAYTIRRGKTCPGGTKIDQFRDEILPRAIELRAAWSGQDVLPAIPFDPENGEYGLWPLASNKVKLIKGNVGDAVKYLQGVMKNSAAQQIAVDGVFGDETKRSVENLQRFFKMKINGEVDFSDIPNESEWTVIDAMALPATIPPPPIDEPYEVVADGLYFMQANQWPYTVAKIVYGDGNRYPELTAANPTVQWGVPGQLVDVPGVPGREYKIKDGDTPLEAIRNLFPDESPYPHLDLFYTWNGGDGRVIYSGEWVFLPES